MKFLRLVMWLAILIIVISIIYAIFAPMHYTAPQ